MSFELIPGKWVGKDFPVFVIAEIGQNHQGKSKLVRLLLIDLVTYFMGLSFFLSFIYFKGSNRYSKYINNLDDLLGLKVP